MQIGADTRAIVTGATHGNRPGDQPGARGTGRTAGPRRARRGRAGGASPTSSASGAIAARRRRRRPRGDHAPRSTRSSRRPAASRSWSPTPGIARYEPFAEQDPEDVERMVRTNVLGTINTVRAGARSRCSTAARGHIVVVSSGAGAARLPLGRRLRRDQGGQQGLRRGAPPRALRDRRLGHHRLPGRGQDLAPRRGRAAPRLAQLRRRDPARAGRRGDDRGDRERPPRGPRPASGPAARAQRRRPRPRSTGCWRWSGADRPRRGGTDGAAQGPRWVPPEPAKNQNVIAAKAIMTPRVTLASRTTRASRSGVTLLVEAVQAQQQPAPADDQRDRAAEQGERRRTRRE